MRPQLIAVQIVYLLLPLVGGSYDGKTAPSNSSAPPLLPLSAAEHVTTLECPLDCSNGGTCTRLSNGHPACLCAHGWTGPQCRSCAHRRLLTAASGTINDGADDETYIKGTQCAWIIKVDAALATKLEAPFSLELTITSFTTECSWDHLYIYDGDNAHGRRLAMLSGALNLDGTMNRTYIAKSGSALLYFAPDHALQMDGFTIDYIVIPCSLDCGAHGYCARRKKKDRCVCRDKEYEGDYCEVRKCAKQTMTNCFHLRGGNCVPRNGIDQCQCASSYHHGRNCNVSKTKWAWDNVYRHIDKLEAALNQGRTGHTMTAVDDRLIIIGGLPQSIYEQYFGVVEYNIASNEYKGSWGVESFTYDPSTNRSTPQHPPVRFEHSAVYHAKNKLIYFFGGYRADMKTISNVIYTFDVDDNQIDALLPSENATVPLPVAGHTMTLVNDTTIVIVMGYNAQRSYTNIVQVYDIPSNSWTIFASPTDDTFSDSRLPMPALYAHSAVWDEHRRRILIYGGYMARNSNSGTSSDTLWSLTPSSMTWRRLSHHRSLFAHAAWTTNGVMVVVGGNAHNETEEEGAKTQRCYAPMAMAYDMVCDSWWELERNNLHDLQVSYSKKMATDLVDGAGLRRFGHAVARAAHDGKSYLYGGFNGAMLTELLVMVTGECASLTSNGKGACLSSVKTAATKCMWLNNACVDFGAAKMTTVDETDDGKVDEKRQPTHANDVCPSAEQLYKSAAKSPEPPAYRPVHPLSVEHKGHLGCAETTDCAQCTNLECTFCNGTCTHDEAQCNTAFRIFAHLGIEHRPVTDGRQCPRVTTEEIACAGASTCHGCTDMSRSCIWYEHRCVATRHIFGAHTTTIEDGEEVPLIQEETPEIEQTGTALVEKESAEMSPRPATSRSQLRLVLRTNDACSPGCEEFSSCESCTTSGKTDKERSTAASKCLWCGTLQRCIPINTYVPSFTYGQCADWTASLEECPIYGTIDDCPLRETCTSCQQGMSCGWCADDTEKGTGKCMKGGYEGGLETKDDKEDGEMCDASDGNKWHFVSCPPCQCNGHSTCLNETITSMFGRPLPLPPARNQHKTPMKHKSALLSTSSIDHEFLTCAACDNHTTGDRCQTCSQMYYGNALNGGNCTECTCHDKATTCNALTGACHCNTKGVIGDDCSACDRPNYMHILENSTCYFELSMDYIFTFKLNDVADRFVTKINYASRPIRPDVDVSFEIDCYQLNATVDLSVYSTSFLDQPLIVTTEGEEEINGLPTGPIIVSPWRHIFVNQPCNGIQHTFSHDDYNFTPEANTTFFVYVKHLQYPVTQLRVTFSQPMQTNWWKFFVIFACVFIGLLVVFFVGWRTKMWLTRRRSRARIIVEMDRMARRPFATVQLDLQDNASLIPSTYWSPSAICVEPMSDYKAAIVTVAVRMPRGGRPFADAGQSGLAVACALTQLPSRHAQLLEADDDDGDSDPDARSASTAKSRLKRLRRRAVRSMSGIRSGLRRGTTHRTTPTTPTVNGERVRV